MQCSEIFILNEATRYCMLGYIRPHWDREISLIWMNPHQTYCKNQHLAYCITGKFMGIILAKEPYHETSGNISGRESVGAKNWACILIFLRL